MIKKIIFFITVIAIILFLGRNLNPFSSLMFEFHDATQPARIQQFTLNLKQLNIPPRVAPDFNFKKGYPVFNFYAPFSYWLTSLINLIGFDIVSSLKLSFLFAILTAFFGSFVFLNGFFDFYPSLLGGVFYITSLYFPVDIFVRGNLAEIWFLALFPWGFYFIIKNSKRLTKLEFFFGVLILSFLFTSHNIYSLISIPLIIIFILLLKNKKPNLMMIGLAILLSSYFWLPALMEMKYIIAQQMAAKTNFRDHFLCLFQLWQSPWGFGGSTPGCVNDGISFKIGKLQIIFFVLGILLFLYKLFIKKNKLNKVSLFFIIYSLLFLFLTIYQSQSIWELFSPVLSVFQFPWRFIGLSLLGISFLSSYFFDQIKFLGKNFVVLVLITAALIINGKYFSGQEIKKSVFEKKYLSQKYIENVAALKIPEYFPKDNVRIDYGRTTIKKTGNILSLITIIGLFIWTILRKKPSYQP
ncbi:hypothetical protein COS50_00905 [Candidatus Roizmanbacteria bacterium CG03_land_8_20_14_0_80_35_26]|uniref:Membrane protein 6-pyruvoyl-tetrahydropterin synthase-related domain-containing protein n=5 Tax=Candidatus Roizmaniibacteriota TaxID=1752723 RepID=A0A2M7BXM0_9BACT|nr:MAG: hypothetical protein COX47_04130 [Candidatus Roizmanbacteria bacterium CG23_combo_of_CG06-09_8_20_14_all_35_49]PIP62884.1 MAG: hypothetical protein COW98_01560 [Candidatus Roizmanbacteria bacterium CG22_combo_CG10-13_8_21_14_all_35_9]PIV11323.1 MAG: hypothetical protein COS50_00905 [Candidatus Roizmanbacteria bacterium CG03_land_8_20_14_0_80_35_26]PIY70663.1 MAG: hypothetical protein COY88_04420 [Candidatus Roizmanbacteria bacterium CG_4_10_14_0_8_um_filter_35_28]PJC33936.1 MAG: hypothe